MHKNINFRFTKFKSLQSSDEKSIKNFNSLYDYNMDCSTTTAASSSTRSDYHSLSVSESDSESETTNTADLATAFASQRFFFSSPGLSNSIVESTSASSSLTSTTSSSSPESDTIAVSKYSMDPFIDFRLSMQEMVEARELVDVNSNWDYLHQLLMRYLSLNPKSTHKFIVGAFSDLLISMMAPPAAKSCLNK